MVAAMSPARRPQQSIILNANVTFVPEGNSGPGSGATRMVNKKSRPKAAFQVSSVQAGEASRGY
jgi:hypothetical protein